MKSFSKFLFSLAAVFCCISIQAQTVPPLILQYDFPAKCWENEALPLGNGNIGAMVFGDVLTDLIQVNEHSLWSGGPGKNPNFNGGHRETAAKNQQNLLRAQEALQKSVNTFSETKKAYIDESGKVVAQNYTDNAKIFVDLLKGTKNDFGSYQSLGNINIVYSSVELPEIINITGDCDNPGDRKSVV